VGQAHLVRLPGVLADGLEPKLWFPFDLWCIGQGEERIPQCAPEAG